MPDPAGQEGDRRPTEEGPFRGEVVVRRHDDTRWIVVEEIRYRGRREEFVVPAGMLTDFASVPRIFTWLLPRYGRYTRAAILHDHLCARARTGGPGAISRVDADGLFRRALREEDVAFLRRWLMWAAVRLGAVREGGPGELVKGGAGPFLAFLAVAIPGALFVAGPGIVILAALLVFYVVEMVTYGLLRAFRRRPRGGEPPKQVNAPGITWKL